ncbi:MAG: hypothetical protein EBE86_022585 [Hormoscilla sp. GUM202]|nr:hypothetical protein [Hormoscilla sp. GUM202]
MTRDIFQNIIKQVDSLSIEEQLELIAYIAEKAKPRIYQEQSHVREDRVVAKPKSLRAIIGTGKGCFKTPQEADEFIRKERDKWSL